MRYSDIYVGQRASLQSVVSADVVDDFAKLSGDDNKLHINEEFAKTTIFKERVAHGMLGMSFISALIGTKLPGDGALWFSHNFEFLNPVRIGDVLNVSGEVIKMFDADNIVEIRVEVFNQNDSPITRGFCKVKVLDLFPEHTVVSAPIKANKVLVVLGANGGLGAAFLRASEKNYDSVITVARGDIKTQINLSKHKHISGDLSKSLKLICNDIAHHIDREFGETLTEISVVNCITDNIPSVDFQKVDNNLVETHLDLNIKLNFLLVQYLVSLYEDDKKKLNFLLISSLYSKTNPKGFSYYSIAKSGLESLVSNLSKDIGPKGHRINCISPSVLETRQTFNMPIRQKQALIVSTPMRRLCTVEDVVELGYFLCSSKASFITGQNIHVNGGVV